MTKLRFFYWIASVFMVLVVVALIILRPENAFTYFIIELGIIYFNFYLKRRDKERLMAITLIYINDCDPKRYLLEFEKYNKTRIRTKPMRIMDKISKALVLLDIGKVEESYDILYSLVNEEPNFNTFMRFWFYKAWIYYYDETNESSRMKYLLDKTTELIELAPRKYQSQLKANFKQIQARYYVKTGIFLDNAENNYSEVFRGKYPKLTVVISVYYLGIIAYKQGKIDLAIERLEAVVKNGKHLYISNKAKELLDKINSNKQEANYSSQI